MTKARDLGDSVNNSSIPGARLVDGSVTQAKRSEDLTRGTLINPAPFSSANYSSLPSWIKRITVMFSGVSLDGGDQLLIRLRTGGSPVSTGYYSISNYSTRAGATGGAATSAGFIVFAGNGSNIMTGSYTFENLTGNLWVGTGLHVYDNDNQFVGTNSGKIALSGVLDGISIVPSGSNLFDSGDINILYE